jgi:ribosomal protein S16
VEHWQKQGAKLSDTVAGLIKKASAGAKAPSAAAA